MSGKCVRIGKKHRMPGRICTKISNRRMKKGPFPIVVLRIKKKTFVTVMKMYGTAWRIAGIVVRTLVTARKINGMPNMTAANGIRKRIVWTAAKICATAGKTSAICGKISVIAGKIAAIAEIMVVMAEKESKIGFNQL